MSWAGQAGRNQRVPFNRQTLSHSKGDNSDGNKEFVDIHAPTK